MPDKTGETGHEQSCPVAIAQGLVRVAKARAIAAAEVYRDASGVDAKRYALIEQRVANNSYASLYKALGETACNCSRGKSK
jgi:hypothetical protein